ncbi:TRAP transporter small permease [Amorphus sp. 3PC139-8]|uniref:TRAP transporter small permease n=1 Tax=Amorphus sp. 3PC139-8 TaxID=2735676 RepID=UPI00345C6A87
MSERTEIGWPSVVLAKVETVLVALSSIAIGSIMLIVVWDVIMRYAFSAPLGWSYELIAAYLVVAAFFFALSDTLHHHGHVAIDLFQPLIPHRTRHLLLALGYAAATVVLALIAWQAWLRLESAWAADSRLSTTMPWPTWPTYAIVVVGTGLVMLRSILRVFGHLASCISGHDLVELPPPPVTSSAGEDAE